MHSKTATRVKKLVNGKEIKDEIALDLVNRILIHSEDVGHQIHLWLDSQSLPPLEIASHGDLQTLVQGKYIYNPPSDYSSEIDSLNSLGKKVGELLQKPVISKQTSMGNLGSEEVIQP